jgi:PTS system nitrogen regulatory IIA component
MRICDLISPADVLVRLKTADKGRLIETLADRAAKATGLSGAEVAEALTKREGLGSTGVGNGIAIPHARLATLIKPHGILACLASPMEYDAIDEQPVDVVFLLLMPAAQQQEQLPALAKIARLLRDKNIQTVLRRAESAETIYSALCDAAKEYPIGA